MCECSARPHNMPLLRDGKQEKGLKLLRCLHDWLEMMYTEMNSKVRYWLGHEALAEIVLVYIDSDLYGPLSGLLRLRMPSMPLKEVNQNTDHVKKYQNI